MKIRTMIASGILGLLCVYEVAFGQQFFDSFKYKASHNSFEREYQGTSIRIPLWEQVLIDNCSMIELDICNKAQSSQTPDLHVTHYCGATYDMPLSQMMEELVNPHGEIFDRFTVIHLQVAQGGSGFECCTGYPLWTDANGDYLAGYLQAYLPLSMTYTRTQWESDGRRFPTVPELRRRGYRFAIELGRGNAHWYFFPGTIGVVETTGNGRFGVFYGRQDGASQSGDGTYLGVAGDRPIFRGYPGYVHQDPEGLGPDVWDLMLTGNMNELAINELEADYTYGNGVFAPHPLYVDYSSVGTERGGPFNEYRTIPAAIARIQAITPPPSDPFVVKVRAGDYDVPPNYRVTQPARIEGLGGVVRIR